jgi:hypothetical protein
MKFDIWIFFENQLWKLNFHWYLKRIMFIFHDDQYTFWSYLAQFFSEREMFQTEVDRWNQNSHCIFNNFFFQNCVIYDVMWKNIVELHRPQMTIWHMHIVWWIPKAVNALRICNTYLLFHSNNGCMNTLHCYVVHTLSAFLL